MSAVDLLTSGTDDESTQSPVSFPMSQQFDTDSEALFNIAPCRSSVSGGARATLDQQLLRTEEDVETFVESTAVHEEVSGSGLFLRRRSISDRVAEQEEEEVPQASVGSPASNRLSKREKNRLKSLRRKQRRRERWLHSQLEQEQVRIHTDIVGVRWL